MTRIKICGIRSYDHALMCADCGAHAIGFVFDENSPRCVLGDSALIERCAKIPFLSKVAVFGRIPTPIPSEASFCDAIQWVEGEPTGGFTPRIHAIRITPTTVPSPHPNADAILLDALHAEKMGGTGMPIDWNLAAEIVRTQSRPVILAGGLTPNNVAEAVAIVKPFGVDVSSGVESQPGQKDSKLIEAFCKA